MYLWALRSSFLPLTWLAGFFLVLSVLLLRWAHPRGIASLQADLSGTIYDLAFVAALAGALLASRGLVESATLLTRIPPARRFATELLLLGLPAAFLVAVVLLTARICRLDLSSASPFGLLLGAAQVGAIALLLARLPLSLRLRGLLLLTLTWLLPTLLSGPSRRWLDPSVHLELGPSWALGSAPALALYLAAFLLGPSRPTPSET